MPAEITRPSTVKNFLKEHSTQRISVEAIPVMVDGLQSIALAIAKKADELSKADNRTTVLDRDIEAALKNLGGIDDSPAGLLKALEKKEAKEVGQLAALIAKWVKEKRKELGIGL